MASTVARGSARLPQSVVQPMPREKPDGLAAHSALVSVAFHVLLMMVVAYALHRSFEVTVPRGTAVGTELVPISRAPAPSAQTSRGASGAAMPGSAPSASRPVPPAVVAPPRRPPAPAPRIITGATAGPTAATVPAPRVSPRLRVVDVPTRPANAPAVELRPGTGSTGGGQHGPPGAEGTQGSDGVGGGSSSPAPHGAPSGTGRPLPPDLALYSAEMGIRLRQFHHLYFSWKRPDDWTIATYRVDRSGRVHDVRIVDTTTPGEVANRVLLVLDMASPFPPLPAGVESIDVEELFWSTPRSPWTPGTRAEVLSHFPDGREITWRGGEGDSSKP